MGFGFTESNPKRPRFTQIILHALLFSKFTQHLFIFVKLYKTWPTLIFNHIYTYLENGYFPIFIPTKNKSKIRPQIKFINQNDSKIKPNNNELKYVNYNLLTFFNLDSYFDPHFYSSRQKIHTHVYFKEKL